MHAILITPETAEKIYQYMPVDSDDRVTVNFCLGAKSRWYAIRDYVSVDGIFFAHAVMPAFVVETSFIVDKEAAAVDWDTIYRLA